jgi:aromatic-L-amino-acid decarboxylase
VSDWIADYLAGVGELPVLPRDLRPGDVRAALPGAPPEHGEPLDRALADFREIVLPGITHWNHPSFFAFFAITGSGPGILGEMITAALNVNAMVWRSSPAATELEEVTLDWLRQLVGLPEAFDGTIQDTASSSTMVALAAARERAYPDSRAEGLWGQRPGRVYASEHTHSSVEKSTIALGFGTRGYRAIPTDDAFRMRPDALRAAIEEDVAAAYGGPAAMVPELRPGFAGWEEADSVVLNPHKWLFTPVDCSALYCRHPEVIVRAFSLVPAYLRMPEQGEARNLMDYGLALGRRFRALKLWFVLRAFGREGLVARIRAHVALARELAGWIDEAEGWERVAPVPLALVVFRWAPEGVDGEEADRLNEAILDRVNGSGEMFVAPTRLNGRLVLRLTIGNLKTTRAHVERAWALLREAAAEV